MKKTYLVTAVAALLALCTAVGAFAIEPYALRESANPPGGAPGVSCPLSTSTNGSAANYKWYNLCAGYIWIYTAWGAGDAVGTQFGGVDQPQVNGDNDVKRTITYFRNVVPAYNQTVDVFVDVDANLDGCIDNPGSPLLSDLNLDPGLRWNCSDFNANIPCDVNGLIVRLQHDGGAAPTFATDGARQERCPYTAPQKSWYYGVNGSTCLQLVGPDGSFDNWVLWLVLDTSEPCINATESKSWGEVKGLYR